MRMHVAIEPLLDPPFGKPLLHVARCNSLTQLRQKQRVVITAEQAAQIQPMFDPRHRVAPNWQAALFAAFTHHPHFP